MKFACTARDQKEADTSAISLDSTDGDLFMYMSPVSSTKAQDSVCFYKFGISEATASDLRKYWNREKKVDQILLRVRQSSEPTLGGKIFSFSELTSKLTANVPATLRRRETFTENMANFFLFRLSNLPAGQRVKNELEDLKKDIKYIQFLSDEELKVLYTAKDKSTSLGTCPRPDTVPFKVQLSAAESVADYLKN